MVDVAHEAGVSLKTVSRVVNEPDTVRPATRNAVNEAMERLGFRTNYAARSLKLGAYKSIGLVIFDLFGGNLSVLNGIASAAADQGYAITLIKRMSKEELSLSEAARRMGQLPVDGMIFNLAQMVDDFAEYRSPVGLRTVIITPFEHATCSTVSDDQEGAARAACRRLIELGHRHIRFIAGPSNSLASKTASAAGVSRSTRRDLLLRTPCTGIGALTQGMRRAQFLPKIRSARRFWRATITWRTARCRH